jgi:hypothetical protein
MDFNRFRKVVFGFVSVAVLACVGADRAEAQISVVQTFPPPSGVAGSISRPFPVQADSVVVVGIYQEGAFALNTSNVKFGPAGNLQQADAVHQSDRGTIAYFINPSSDPTASIELTGLNFGSMGAWELSGVDRDTPPAYTKGDSVTTAQADMFIVSWATRNGDGTISLPSAPPTWTLDMRQSFGSGGWGAAGGSVAAPTAAAYNANWGNDDPFYGPLSLAFTADADTTPPTVDTLVPADDATVATPTWLKVTFSEAITTNTTGSITITNITAGTADIIPAGSGELVVSGADLVITPTSALSNHSDYAVLISTNAIKDLSGNPFAGIINDTTWNFTTTTPDTNAPTIQATSPADDATGVALDTNLVATFIENIAVGSGNIVISNLTHGTSTTIAVSDATQVTVSGTTLTIDPTAYLLPSNRYAILIDSGAIEDDPAGNAFAGITDTNDWNFTTLDAVPNLIIHYTFDGDTGTTAVDSGMIDGQQNLTIRGASAFTSDAERGDVLDNKSGASLSFSSTTRDYTFMLWYKGTGGGYLYDQRNRFVPSLERNAVGIGVIAPNSPNAYSTADTTANDGSWHHVAWVFEKDGLGAGTDSLSIYLDGHAQDLYVRTGNTTIGALVGTEVPLTIDRDLGPINQYLFSTTDGANYGLNGLVDDVRIYDRALSRAEVAALGDTTAPTIDTLVPTHSATVATPTWLKVTFSEAITTNTTGSITITNITAGTAHIIPAGSGELVVSGPDLVIRPTPALSNHSDYAVLISTNAIRDSVGHFFGGYTNATDWSFTTTTPDVTGPTIQTTSPADNAHDVGVGTHFVATFSENIVVGSGNILITNSTDGTATTIAVTDGTQVTVSGTTLTIDPTSVLAGGEQYAILIDEGAVTDTPAGNPFAGITRTSEWNFKTKAVALLAYYPFDSDFNDAFGTNDLTAGSGSPAIANTVGAWKFGGGAAYFDGTSTLNFSTQISFGSDQAWSVSFWYVIPTDVDGRPLQDANGPSQFWYRGGNPGVYVYSGGPEPQLRTAPGGQDSYHHIVFVSYGDGYVDWYYNKVSLAPYADKEGQSLADMVAAGHRFPFTINRAGAGGPQFLDDLAIFDGALSASQVAELFDGLNFDAWKPPPATGILLIVR